MSIYLVIHGEVRVLIIKERLGDDAHLRTKILLKDNRSLWL